MTQALQFQRAAEAGVIAGFQEPGAQMTVHLGRRANGLLADSVRRVLD